MSAELFSFSNILAVAQLLALIAGGIGLYFAMRYDIRLLTHKMEAIVDEQEALDQKLTDLKSKMYDNLDESKRVTGEVMMALRQKVTDVELYIRDNFVRRETFTMIFSRVETDIKSLENKIEEGFRRIDERLRSG